MADFIEKTHFIYDKHTEYIYSSFNENLQVVLYSLIGFCTPFFLGHPQFLVGSIVNMMLILGAQNLKGYKLFAMIITPSLGVFSAGLLFGGLTKYLLYLMPMIWIGNMILVYGYKYLRSHYKNSVLNSISFAILAKVLILTVNAYILVSFNVVPSVFLTAMSVLQLVTAVSGAFVALLVTKYVLSKYSLN